MDNLLSFEGARQFFHGELNQCLQCGDIVPNGDYVKVNGYCIGCNNDMRNEVSPEGSY